MGKFTAPLGAPALGNSPDTVVRPMGRVVADATDPDNPLLRLHNGTKPGGKVIGEEPGAARPKAGDNAAGVRKAFNVVKSQLALAEFGLRYGAGTVELEPGVYDYSETLEFLADGKLVGKGPPGAVVLNYTGTDIATVIGSRQLTNVAPNLAPQNTRTFEMNNIAIVAKQASEGIRFGAASQVKLNFNGLGIFGVKGRPINCGVSVYFLGLHNLLVRGCEQPSYIGEYCDLLTIDDRSAFFGNPNGALLLECPTALIMNTDFEGNSGFADIEVRLAANMAANRNIELYKNRFGPEVAAGGSPVQYDIALTKGAGVAVGSALTDLKIVRNDHFTGGNFAKKQAPVLIDVATRRLYIDNHATSAYTSPYDVVATTPDNAFAIGVTTSSHASEFTLVQPEISGLFGGSQFLTNPKPNRPFIAVATPAFTAVKKLGWSNSEAGPNIQVNALVASSGSTGYADAYGLTLHDCVAQRHARIAMNGEIITTNIDTTGSTFNAPLYLQDNGTLGLAVPAGKTALRIARVLTIGANARIQIDIEKV